MKQADTVEIAAQSLVEHTECRSNHEDDAGPTEKGDVAFGNVHVTERFGSIAAAVTAAACGTAFDQFSAPFEGEAEKETTKSKKEAGRDGMAQKCTGSSHGI